MSMQESRTWMGGVALVLTGAILTSMMQLYFDGEYSGVGFGRARWWWEIAMNLQVLSLALMWFCYADRVSDRSGRRKSVMRFLMISSLFFVSMPFWVVLLSLYMNWFFMEAPLELVGTLVFSIIGLWMLVAMVSRVLHFRGQVRRGESTSFWALIKPRQWYTLVPTYLVAAVTVYEIINGGTLHYETVPLLLYIQAAVPFFAHSLRRRRAASGNRVTAR